MGHRINLILAVLVLVGCAGSTTAGAQSKENTEPEDNSVFRADRFTMDKRNFGWLGQITDKHSGKICNIYELQDAWQAPHIAFVCDGGNNDTGTHAITGGKSSHRNDTTVN